MKVSTTVIARFAFCIVLLLALHTAIAQLGGGYNSPYNQNGNVKNVEQRRYDESQNKQYKVTPSTSPATESRYRSTTPNTRRYNQNSDNVKKNEYPEKPAVIIYDETSSANEFGLKQVSLNGKKGFINEAGKVIVPVIYDELTYNTEGLLKAKLNMKYGMMNRWGKMVVPLIYDEIGPLYYENRFAVRLDTKWGFYNLNGTPVIPIRTDLPVNGKHCSIICSANS